MLALGKSVYWLLQLYRKSHDGMSHWKCIRRETGRSRVVRDEVASECLYRMLYNAQERGSEAKTNGRDLQDQRMIALCNQHTKSCWSVAVWEAPSMVSTRPALSDANKHEKRTKPHRKHAVNQT